MLELDPRELDLVHGGDHWCFERISEDGMTAAARSYSYGEHGFWGASIPSCTSTTELQFRTVTTTTTSPASCSLTASFPFIACTVTPSRTTTHTATTTRTTLCSH